MGFTDGWVEDLRSFQQCLSHWIRLSYVYISTVFQSYQDGGRVTICCALWNPD